MNPSSIEVRAPASGRLRRRHVVVVIGLGLATALAHGWALQDGLFLDDHWHQLSMREADWSFSDLVASTTLEPGTFLHAWWQDKDFCWQYGRPVTMAWMKLVQLLTGGSVPLQHLSSIVWHFACAILVYGLCFKISGHRGWSAFAGLMFVIYPHSAYAVGWLAAQNAVIQTTLTLAALLCYAHASGLQLCGAVTGPHPEGCGLGEGGTGAVFAPRCIPSLRLGSYLFVLLLFGCALFSRENAIVFPLLTMGLDLAFGGVRHLKARWRFHLILLAMALGFVVWRVVAFEGAIPEVYVRRPDGWDYPLWLFAKLLHYVVCAIWLTPMVIGPTGRSNPFSEVPWDCALMIIILLAMGAGYYFACRKHVRGYWFWPMWIVLAVLPVVPVFATPHSGYMAGVGFALAVVMKPALAPARASRGSIAAAIYLLIASIAAFSIYRVCWRGVVRAEQYTIAQMSANSKPPVDSELFLINLPLANIYLPLNLQESWSMAADELHCHVLTYAPHVLMGPGGCRIEQLDGYSFLLSIDDQLYFSGLLGQFLTKAIRHGDKFEVGEVIRGEPFDVEVIKTSGQGVSQLKFTFREPLASDRYRFYLISEDFPGKRLLFERDPQSGQDINLDPVLPQPDAVEGAVEMRRARRRLFAVLETTARIIRTDLYLTGPSRSSP